jgi:hypothetical protein
VYDLLAGRSCVAQKPQSRRTTLHQQPAGRGALSVSRLVLRHKFIENQGVSGRNHSRRQAKNRQDMAQSKAILG